MPGTENPPVPIGPDPVEERCDGWWFYDETWSWDFGPFETEAECREALRKYAETI